MRKTVIRALLLSLLALAPGLCRAQDFAGQARAFRRQLAERALPYWLGTVDTNHGGFLLADDAAQAARPATEKQVVTQARLVWAFSHASRLGLARDPGECLRAAKQGYEFLTRHFRDSECGGYYWTTELDGRPRDQRKILYGEAFVIYGLVEYHRASGEPQALEQALALFRTLQRRAHDDQYGGWLEDFQRDWTPILGSPPSPVEISGGKSANTHLHWMEALTELCLESRDPAVERALREALKINQTRFYPKTPARCAFHKHRDWSPVTEARSQGLSYGHNVEFAWLMIRAERALGRKPSWDHFQAYLEHALRFGYDHERGGLYSRGQDDQPALDTDKIWWVQAEMLAALTDALKHRFDPARARALDQLLAFLSRCQTDARTGVWLESVTAEGAPRSTALAHNWKANYHDLRALGKFIQAFAPE